MDGVLDSSLTDNALCSNYAEAMERGIAKVMAKMGISTLQSYKGAQIFEAVGLSDEVIDKCFKGTQSRIGGVTFDILAKEAFERHQITYWENLWTCLLFATQESIIGDLEEKNT